MATILGRFYSFGTMLSAAAQASVRKQKLAAKRAAHDKIRPKQADLFTMGFQPTQLDQAERAAAQAEAFRKQSSVAAAAQQAHPAADGMPKTMRLFGGRLTVAAPAKPTKKEFGRPRGPRGLDMQHPAVDLCKRVDYDGDGLKRTACMRFGCNCEQFSRLIKHSTCKCGHTGEEHEVFEYFGPPLEEVRINVGE